MLTFVQTSRPIVYGGENVPAGTFHGGENVPAGTFHSN